MKVHKIIFEEVKKIVNMNDPVGLVEGGAPDDEYHTEIGKIVILLREDLEVETLANKIQGIFLEAFENDAELEKSTFLTISQQLLDLKNRLHW